MSSLSASQIAGHLRKAGFPEDKIDVMSAIAMAESSGNPKAHNPNASTGDNSFGLFQINMLGGMGPERRRQFGITSNEQLFDPQTNAIAAKKIYDQQGLGAWSVYKNKAYEKFLGQSQGNGAAASTSSSATLGNASSQDHALVSGFQELMKSMLGQRSSTPAANPFMGAINSGDPFMAALPGLGFAGAASALQGGKTRMAGGQNFFQSMLGSLGLESGPNLPAAAGAALASPKSPAQGFMDMMLGALGIGQEPSVDSTRMAGGAINNIKPTGGAIKVGRIADPKEDVFPTTGAHLHVEVINKKGEHIDPGTARSLLQNLVVGDKPLYQQTAQGLEPSRPVTSRYGKRNAPTAGASTFHKGKDFGVSANTPLKWRGGGNYSFSGGIGVIDLQDGMRIRLLHTRPS